LARTLLTLLRPSGPAARCLIGGRGWLDGGALFGVPQGEEVPNYLLILDLD
jgi:hypothetical protein